MVKKYLFYLIRWQLSTPILAFCVVMFATFGATVATVFANLIGGLIFFWVDRWIFSHTRILQGELWEVQEDVRCADCGAEVDKGYRLVRAEGYDRTGDSRPEFRCHECSRRKYERDHTDETETIDDSQSNDDKDGSDSDGPDHVSSVRNSHRDDS